MLNFFAGIDAATEADMRAEMDAEALASERHCSLCECYGCVCDALRLAGAAECERLWAVNGTVAQ